MDDRRGLTLRILVGMAAGLAVGLALNLSGATGPVVAFFAGDGGLFELGGQIFLKLLKLLVVPLVFVSIVCGVAALDDLSRLGRVGGKTLGLYLLTTALAISLALSAAMLVRPGEGIDRATGAEYQAQTPPTISETILNLVPDNPVQALADAEMLQIIVFAALFGVALTLSGEGGRRLVAFFEDLNTAVLRLVMILMETAPYGVFCLVAHIFAVEGVRAVQPLLWYFVVVLAVLLLHALVVYPTMLRVLGGLSPRPFLRKMRSVWAVAFSTSSSGATLPVTLETVERRMGVDKSVASFTVPLGATLNMDGTAIMQGVATGFIAQAYGIDLGLTDLLTVVVTATLASIGTAAVPGVGLVMLAMVLRQVNLPVEGIGLVLGVDRLLDMVRTAVNVTGDAAVTCVVARSEGEIDVGVYGDVEAR